MDGRRDGRAGGRAQEGTDGRTNERADARTSGPAGGRMDGWASGRTSGQADRQAQTEPTSSDRVARSMFISRQAYTVNLSMLLINCKRIGLSLSIVRAGY